MLVIVKVVVCIVINFFFTMIDKGLFRVGQKARRRQYNGQYGKIKLSCIPYQGTEGAFAISPGTQQAQTPEPAQCQQPEKPVPAQGHKPPQVAKIVGKISQGRIYPPQKPVFGPGGQA